MKKIAKTNEKSKRTFKDLADEYIRKCRLKNCSWSTVCKYTEIYHYFNQFFPENASLTEINDEVMEDYIFYEKNKGVKDSTINIRLAALNTLFKYAYEQEYMADRVYTQELKIDEEIKETYTKHELQILLKKPNIKKCSFAEYRTWAVINFLLGTGCRAATLRNIKIGDINTKEKEITFVHTKSRRQYVIPLSVVLYDVLSDYLKVRGGEPSDYLFVSQTGQKMTKNCLTQSILSYNRKRGIERTGIHLFRHTFAKMWIKNKGDAFRLQKILGHANFNTTRRYVNMFAEDLKQDFDEYNPLKEFKREYITMKK